MTTGNVTSENMGERMFEAAQTVLNNKFYLVESFLRGESEKLAITLRMIVEASAKGEITSEEAKLLLNQQRHSILMVLTAAEGMAAVTVQSAINAALQEVRDFVNGRIGFPLL